MKTFARILSFVALFAVVGAQAAQPAGSRKVSSVQVQGESRVSINTASAPQLASALTGVGMKKAMEIVEYRRTHGPFKSIEELMNVNGIGAATLLKNKNRLSL
jgi:competence protein ComEA